MSVDYKEARKKLFAHEYIKDYNAGAAYERAGYKSKTKSSRDSNASRLMRDDKVVEYIREAEKDRNERLVLDQNAVLQEYLRVGMSDMTNYVEWNEFGIQSVVASEDLTDDMSRAIESIEFQESDTPHGTNRKMKIKLHPKLPALDALSKYLGLYAKDNKQKSDEGGKGLSALLDMVNAAKAIAEHDED